jgi:hypothetical protein
MTKEENRTAARTPEMPPIKPDGGGSLKSTANSCPAKPPIKEETMTCKKLSGGGKEVVPESQMRRVER